MRLMSTGGTCMCMCVSRHIYLQMGMCGICTCMHGCAHTCGYMYFCACTCVCMCVGMCVHVCACTVFVCAMHIQVCLYVYMCASECGALHAYTCIYVCIYGICVHTCALCVQIPLQKPYGRCSHHHYRANTPKR